jgi:energy-coupling factor transporter ATP-binding protein EcfA2
VVVDALGVPIGIPVSGAAAARLRRQWSRALTDRPAVTVVDLDQLDTDDDVAHDYAVTSRVTLAALDATAGLRINLHAGAVADEQGRALVVIGPSGSGKTTAVQLLARRLGYLSDETTSVDDSLAVHPHPKPLSVIIDRDAPLLKHSLSPDELDLLRPPPSAHLHRIVLLHRGDTDLGLVPITPARAIAEIVAQTSSLVRLEHPVRRLADTIDACGGVWALHYREVEHWLDDLVGLLDVEGRPPPPRLHHPGAGDADAGDAADGSRTTGAWTRTPWRDAVEYDEELVVMVDSRVHVLAGLGVVLWLALSAPQTTDQLVTEVQELWGAHPDAVTLVGDALGLLATEGLLRPPG